MIFLKKTKQLLFLSLFSALAILNCFGQVINIESKRFFNDTNGWVGSSDLYFQFTQNTQQIISLGTTSRAQYAKRNHKFLILNDVSFVKAGNQDFSNSGFQHVRYSYKVKKWLALETFLQAQYNAILKIKLRFLAGSGPRVRLVKRENFKLYVAILYMREYEDVSNIPGHSNVNRISAYTTFAWSIKEQIEFSSTIFYQPNLGDFNDYRIAGDGAFEFGITKKLTFKLSYNFLYDTRQPVGIPSLVYTIKNGISYKF